MTDSCFLPGRYQSLEVLSRGTHTSLLRAHDKDTRSDVALKVIHVPSWMTVAEADGYLDRICLTLAPLTGVSHPGVASTFALDRTRDSLIVSREYVQGRSLGNHLETRWILGQMEARRIAVEAAAALDALRAAGVAHNALTPSNIILRESGELVLTDAAISTAAKQFSVAGMSCTLQARKSPGGDLHALASLVLLAVTGLMPDGADLSSWLELPAGMREPIRRALGRDRSAFRSATEFARSLEPVPISQVFRHVWQPAAAVGLLAALATAGGNAVSEARHAAGTAKRHVKLVSAAEPVIVSLPHVLDTLAPEDAGALAVAVREQGPAVLANPAVSALIAVSDAQRTQISDWLAGHRDSVGRMVEAAAGGNQIDTAATMAELKLETNGRILSVLNATQRARWEQLERDIATAGERTQ